MQIPMVLNSPEFTLAYNMLQKLKQAPNKFESYDLYGLYQQAVVGPVTSLETDDPYWKAWNKYKDLNTYNSEVKFIDLVNELINKYGIYS
jgi:acyl-CoA-binding protein